MKWFHTVIGIFVFVLAGFLSINPALVQAHAKYKRSNPPADAVIPAPPTEVEVWFTQELFRREGANTLAVFGPDGTQVDQKDAHIDDDDRAQMRVTLSQNLPDGDYIVRWQTLSIDDGDDDQGEFSFTVDPTADPLPPDDMADSPSPETAIIAETVTSPPNTSPSAPEADSQLPCLSGVIITGLFVFITMLLQRFMR